MKLRGLIVRVVVLGAASAVITWLASVVVPEPPDPFAPSGGSGRNVLRAGVTGAVFGLVTGLI